MSTTRVFRLGPVPHTGRRRTKPRTISYAVMWWPKRDGYPQRATVEWRSNKADANGIHESGAEIVTLDGPRTHCSCREWNCAHITQARGAA